MLYVIIMLPLVATFGYPSFLLECYPELEEESCLKTTPRQLAICNRIECYNIYESSTWAVAAEFVKNGSFSFEGGSKTL